MSTLYKPPGAHRCYFPNAWHTEPGTVWKCDRCGAIYRAQGGGICILWVPASKRWLRKHHPEIGSGLVGENE